MRKFIWLAVFLILISYAIGFADWKDGLLIWSPSIKLGFATTMMAEGIMNIMTGAGAQEYLAASAFLLCYTIPNAFLLSDIMNEKPANVRFWRQCNLGIDIALLCAMGFGFPLRYLEPWKSNLNSMTGSDFAAIYAGGVLLFFGMVWADSIPFSIESGRIGVPFAKRLGFSEHLSFTIVDEREGYAPFRMINPSPRFGIFFRL